MFDETMRVCVIIPAAGRSSRFNAGGADVLGHRSKLDEDLSGRPVLQRTVELFAKHPDVVQTIVAGPADDEAFADFKLRHGDRLELLGCTLCRGALEHRYETVLNALALVDDGVTHIAVHDGARPCASTGLIEAVFAAARAHGAAVPVVEVNDTIKRLGRAVASEPDPAAAILGYGAGIDGGVGLRAIDATVDRANLATVQTPQVFERALLMRAYAQTDLSSTDDAGLVERLGETVVAVPGDPRNIKITLPDDVELARMILNLPRIKERATNKKF